MSNVRKRKVVSCGACVYRECGNGFEVLLVRPFSHNPAWGIPKGHIDFGESKIECAIREVHEETGIDISLEEMLHPVKTCFNQVEKTVYAFMARQTSHNEACPFDNENVDVRWFHIKSLPKLHTYQVPLMQEAIRLLMSKHNY